MSSVRPVQPAIDKAATPRGEVTLTTVSTERGAVVLVRAAGHGDAALLVTIVAHLDQALTRGRVEVFHDFAAATGYDAGLRYGLTGWVKAHDGAIDGTHVLVTSRVIAIGVAAANLAIGGRLLVYTERARFDAALDGRLPRLRYPETGQGAELLRSRGTVVA